MMPLAEGIPGAVTGRALLLRVSSLSLISCHWLSLKFNVIRAAVTVTSEYRVAGVQRVKNG